MATLKEKQGLDNGMAEMLLMDMTCNPDLRFNTWKCILKAILNTLFYINCYPTQKTFLREHRAAGKEKQKDARNVENGQNFFKSYVKTSCK